MRVLITGSDGYLGALVAPYLCAQGFEVVGLDTGYYKSGWLCSERLTQAEGTRTVMAPATLVRDIRDVKVDDLRGFDAIVHMAELSNDPLGELIGEVTYDVNHLGSVHLAKLAKQAGVQRFVYMSSCSVYGVAEGVVDHGPGLTG